MSDESEPHLFQSYDVPSFPAFGPADIARFRLVLSAQGWSVGIVWTVQELAGLPGRAGITASAWTKAMRSLEEYLAECSHDHVDGVVAYDALVADTRGVTFSQEFEATGDELEAARQWALGYSGDSSWAGGVDLPSRTRAWMAGVAPTAKLSVAYTTEVEPLGLVAQGEPSLLREGGQWLVIPDDAADLGPAPWVRSGFVRVYDAYGLDALAMTSVRKAFSPLHRSRSTLWKDTQYHDVPEGELHLHYTDDEPVGLFASNSKGVFVRGQGRWYRLPPKSPLTESWDVIEVGQDAIYVWDELERNDQISELDHRLADLLAPGGADNEADLAPTNLLFDFRIPEGIAGELDARHPHLIAKGPFVVEVGADTKLLGCDLRREGDEVQWWDGGKTHVLDASCATALYEDEGFILIGDAKYGTHLKIRPLLLSDAAWALPLAVPTPRTLSELKRLADELLHQPSTRPEAQDQPVPDDGSWLIIDLWMGHVFSEEAVMVPQPPIDIHDDLADDAAVDERMAYAAEHGRRLLMPGSPGTSVDELEEWDNPPWLIDAYNGDSSWQPWQLRIVPSPDDANVLDDLHTDEEFVRSYASKHGEIPVVPFELC